jgi:hypothetical protein
VVLLEPIDLYFGYRSLLGGSLFGPGKEPDNVLITTQASAAACGTEKRHAGEPHAAQPEKIFAAYCPWHLSFTCSPCSREAFL